MRAAALWACRTGKAMMKIPRAPPVTTVGDRISWLEMDSKATREWAMVPMAMSLSLDTTSFVPNKAARVLPSRMVIHPRQEFVQRKEMKTYTWANAKKIQVKTGDQQLNGQHHFWKGSTAPMESTLGNQA